MPKFFLNYQTELIYLGRILFASLCGLALGIERSKRQKEAGIRTHFVVATASALLMCVSISFVDDTARIAAQIVSGIGFLGAGMIFFRRESLHGLTTAAGIWATAGIGMAAGNGMYILSLGSTALIFIALSIFAKSKIVSKNNVHLFMVKFDYTTKTKQLLQDFFEVDVFNRFKATEGEGNITSEAVIRTKKDIDADQLVQLLETTDDIFSIERLEDM